VLAKCSRCTQTFQTERLGEQFCPFCGAAVMIAGAPGAPALGGPIPIPGGPGDAQDQDAPVDRPADHGGWFAAAVATWKQSVLAPNVFFARLRPGPDTGGALGYAVAVLLVGGFFAGAVSILQGALQRGQYAQLESQLGQLPPEARSIILGMLHFIQPSLSSLVIIPLISVVGFFVNAALFHLALMIVGGNKQGFTATLRALAFAQGPALFNVLPFCGSAIGGIWTLVLNVMGLSALHRVGVGRVIGAYAVLLFGLCCLCIVPIGVAAGVMFSRAASAHVSSPVDVP
jgi:hypothetical protein